MSSGQAHNVHVRKRQLAKLPQQATKRSQRGCSAQPPGQLTEEAPAHMRKHLIALVLSAGTASALVLVLGAAGSPSSPNAVVAATQVAAGGRAAASGGTWGTARRVAGALNTGGAAEVRSVSCGSPGNCSAGGNLESSTGSQAWVASEKNGKWGAAKTVAGALNAGGNASIGAVSCASAGNCGAGGTYGNRSGRMQAFVISEVNGTWRTAREIAGALNTGGNAQVYTVSCGSAGNCSAGGYYRDRSGRYQAFAVAEKNGKWGTAKTVARALNAGGNASIGAVSCASAGNCSAGGQYVDRSRHSQAFVINQVHGTWGRVTKVAAPIRDGSASIDSVSCGSAGNCSAGGSYSRNGSARAEMFVVDEVHGRWGTAREVPGSAALNTGGAATLWSVSCASAGNCSAGGSYRHGDRGVQAFVVNEVDGTWRNGEEVPGTAALNAGGNAQVGSVSCASAGNCSAAGFYADVRGHMQAFVVDEVHGTWGNAKEVPGTAARNQGGHAVVASLSCASASHCSAGGYYFRTKSVQQAFVVNKS
jgi:D-alanine-D-alanine ligase-like ATP-grasp enzyme